MENLTNFWKKHKLSLYWQKGVHMDLGTTQLSHRRHLSGPSLTHFSGTFFEKKSSVNKNLNANLFILRLLVFSYLTLFLPAWEMLSSLHVSPWLMAIFCFLTEKKKIIEKWWETVNIFSPLDYECAGIIFSVAVLICPPVASVLSNKGVCIYIYKYKYTQTLKTIFIKGNMATT